MKQQFILVSSTLLMVVLLVGVLSCGPALTPAPVPNPTAPSTAAPSEAPAPPPPQSKRASGTLAKIDGNTLTLTTAQGSVTVSVNSDTTFRKTAIGTSADIIEGALIFAIGEKEANGNITATSIRILSPDESTRQAPSTTRPPSTQRERTGTAGTVTKLAGTVLTLNTGQGTVTMNINANTTIQKTVNGGLSDLRGGESISVTGQDASGSIAATSIRIQSEGQSTPNPPSSK
jgi:hypothetical protein